MMLPDDTRIAGKKTVADWKAVKGRLAGCNGRPIWEEAFSDFFKARLDSRYFEPVRTLEKTGSNVGEGFAIVTLHCSLIEFLAATLEGKTHRYFRNGDPHLGEFEYSDSRNMFVQFLRQRPPFDGMFRCDRTAEDFYASVRCGLLHEARTKGRWRIRVCESAALAIDANAKVVYRDKMQAAFDRFATWYKQQLPADTKLQQAFIRKFDSLCDE